MNYRGTHLTVPTFRARVRTITERVYRTASRTTLLNRVREDLAWSIEHIPHIAALVSLLMYSAFWAAAMTFYRPLNVGPEEVGLGPGELIGRSMVGFTLFAIPATAVFLAAVAGLSIVGSLPRLLLASVRLDARIARAIGASVILLLAVLVILSTWNQTHRSSSSLSLFIAVTSMTVAAALTAVGIASGWLARHHRVGIGLSLTAIVFYTYIVYIALGIDARNSVVAGHEPGIDRTFGVPIAPWDASIAVPMWTSSAPSDLRQRTGDCIIYLGASNGTYVVYDADRFDSLRIPAADVVISLGGPNLGGCSP